MHMTTKHIHVTCAIIEQDDGLVLAAQRNNTMSMPLKWEFPGGKIEPHECAEDCLRRELVEELGIYIHIKNPLPPSTYNYPGLTVTLFPFVCSITSGTLILYEHAALCWKKPYELLDLDWAAADVPVLESYLIQRSSSLC
jgi:8-oxo-dGTP diphosphatase